MSDETGAAGDPGWHNRELARIEDKGAWCGYCQAQLPPHLSLEDHLAMTHATETTDLVVVPATGELIDLADLPKVAVVLDELAQLEREIKLAKRYLTDALDAESERQARRTIELDGGIIVELSSRTRYEWDIEQLRERLVEAGMPAERLEQLIVPTYKVNSNVARSVRAASAAYAQAIDACRTEVPATVYVRGIRR